jgi:hypothetical protein
MPWFVPFVFEDGGCIPSPLSRHSCQILNLPGKLLTGQKIATEKRVLRRCVAYKSKTGHAAGFVDEHG